MTSDDKNGGQLFTVPDLGAPVGTDYIHALWVCHIQSPLANNRVTPPPATRAHNIFRLYLFHPHACTWYPCRGMGQLPHIMQFTNLRGFLILCFFGFSGQYPRTLIPTV